MTEKHTPFPWTIYDDSDPVYIQIKGKRSDIGDVHIATVIGRANAQLIISLSDLVKALEEIAACDQRHNGIAANFMQKTARAALAKAKSV